MWTKNNVHVITGPNMGWKSTFLRQNALMVIMAHMGIDIPAKTAEIWIIDKVFSRVWAGDNLFLGQSTFMLEMQEITFILENATDRSFVVIDEIWRWTSTFDGMSLAWAILKFIHDTIKSHTLFATHYHEIIDHSQELKDAKNFSVAVWENEDNIIFLRKVVPGGVKKSYGIEVAKLAWIPKEVLIQARKTMIDLENDTVWSQLQIVWIPEVKQLREDPINRRLLDQLRKIKLEDTSPMQALLLLEWFQKLIKKSK